MAKPPQTAAEAPTQAEVDPQTAAEAPTQAEVDPYATLDVIETPVRFKLPAPALTDGARALATRIADAEGPTYLNVGSWEKSKVSGLTRVIKANADTLFPGKSLRVTQGTDAATGTPVLKFALGNPRKPRT